MCPQCLDCRKQVITAEVKHTIAQALSHVECSVHCGIEFDM